MPSLIWSVLFYCLWSSIWIHASLLSRIHWLNIHSLLIVLVNFNVTPYQCWFKWSLCNHSLSFGEMLRLLAVFFLFWQYGLWVHDGERRLWIHAVPSGSSWVFVMGRSVWIYSTLIPEGCGPGCLLPIITFLCHLGLIPRSHQTLVPSTSLHSILKAPRIFSVSTCPVQAVRNKRFISLVISLSYSLMLQCFILALSQSSQKALPKVLLGMLNVQSRTEGSITCFQFSLSLYKMPFLTGILAQRRGVGTYVSHDLPLHPS